MIKPLVSVVMITYAHEDFIEQAVNGILMQECNFEIELIISNDCSPDNTDLVINTIIKNHPKASCIKYIKHMRNLGMMPNFIFALKESKGKYIALCEGDDYWIDSLKLQKQVDFLENHDEYSLSFTKSMELFHDKNLISETKYPENISNLTFYELLEHNWFIRTATILFRRKQIDLNFLSKIEYGADYFIHLTLITKGNFFFLNETTSVYRRHIGGISKSNNYVFLKRRFQYISNLKLLDDYLEMKFTNLITNEIKNARIGIFDFAIINFHFFTLRFVKISEILPLLKHLIQRFINKMRRYLKKKLILVIMFGLEEVV